MKFQSLQTDKLQPCSPCQDPSDDLLSKRIKSKHSKSQIQDKGNQNQCFLKSVKKKPYKVGLWIKFVFIKGMFPPFTLIVHLKACKRGFERVIGERSGIAVISSSRVVQDPLRGLCDPLGGARPVQHPSTVQKYNGRDPLGSARPVERPARPVELSCCKLQKIAQSSSKSSNLFKVGSLHIIFVVGDGCKPSCYDFNLKSCK
jgi:hypothetical protein